MSNWKRARECRAALFPAVSGFLAICSVIYGIHDKLHPLAVVISAAAMIAGGFAGKWPIQASLVTATLSGFLVLGMPDQFTGATAALLLPIVGCSAVRLNISTILLCTWTVLLQLGEYLNRTQNLTATGIALQLLLGAPLVGFAVLIGSNLNSMAARQRAERNEVASRIRCEISRELHDTVAYELSVIAMRADHCRRTGTASAEDLTIIADKSREAIADLRSILYLLRSNDLQSNRDALLPWQEIIATRSKVLQTAGFTWQESIEGDIAAIPRPIADVLSRILNEAFNNIERHSAVGPCILLVNVTNHQVELVLTNPLAANRRSATDLGLGLIGMKERARAVGGGLTAEAVGNRWVCQITLGYSMESLERV